MIPFPPYAALHHFADPVRMLREAVRMVKPGGIVAITCERTGNEFDRPHPAIVEALEHGVNERISLDASFQMDDDSLKVILRT